MVYNELSEALKKLRPKREGWRVARCSMKSWGQGVSMRQSDNFVLDVKIHGSSAKKYFHDGRFYVEGREGSEFTIRIGNQTGKRVLAVPTVDGLSVMDGKDGSFESTGYILDPWQGIDIPGWRLSDKKVASFEFTKPHKSYASSKGKGIHGGVVGCAFFYEKEWPTFTVTTTSLPDFPKPIPYPYKMTFSGDTRGDSMQTQNAFFAQQGPMMASSSVNMVNASFSSANMKSSNLGTGFGDEVQHKVYKSAFERASDTPAEVLTVYYDTKSGLKDRGINVEGTVEIASAFPKENREELDGYCKPPVGWRG
jgi:hypothetical protein